jgi:CRP/FNR family transcriptional regulator
MEVSGSVGAAALRGVPLFAGLSEATLTRIAAVGQSRTYEAGEHILLEGEPCIAAYVVLDGTVRVYRVSREGREQVLVRLKPGQAFNTVPLFQPQGTNEANAVAVTDVTLWLLLKDDFLALTRAHGDLAIAILGDFARRLSHLTDLVENLALYTVESRLARFLLDHAPPAPTDSAGLPDEEAAPAITERWTQQDIATHLGTVRDMVGRELRAFQDAGLIRLGRGKIVLLDPEGLKTIAKGL